MIEDTLTLRFHLATGAGVRLDFQGPVTRGTLCKLIELLRTSLEIFPDDGVAAEPGAEADS